MAGRLSVFSTISSKLKLKKRDALSGWNFCKASSYLLAYCVFNQQHSSAPCKKEAHVLDNLQPVHQTGLEKDANGCMSEWDFFASWYLKTYDAFFNLFKFLIVVAGRLPVSSANLLLVNSISKAGVVACPMPRMSGCNLQPTCKTLLFFFFVAK